jgi:hypothetical protein
VAPVLEVLIGLFFLYLILSLIVSAINESIAGLLGRRSKYLEKGITSLLGPGLTADFFAQPLIRSLSNDNARLKYKKMPSYISASTFTESVLDLLRNGPSATARSTPNSPAIPGDEPQNRRQTGTAPEPPIHDAIRIFAGAAKDLDDFKKKLDAWYEEAMNRVSGWYNRYTRLLLFIIGIILVSVINADTVNIVSTLWRDASIREAVVEQAATVASGEQPDPDQARDQLSSLEELNLPLGWSLVAGPSDPRGLPATVGGYASKILGVLITAIALTFGSTFWFDLLKKFVGIRSSGAEPQPAQAGPPSGAAEQPQRLEILRRL